MLSKFMVLLNATFPHRLTHQKGEQGPMVQGELRIPSLWKMQELQSLVQRNQLLQLEKDRKMF